MNITLFRKTMWFTLLVICCTFPRSGFAQSDESLSDMELIERVDELQRDLVAPEVSKRDGAEKELIDLGVRVLDHLEAPERDATTDLIERLGRVRIALEKIAVASVTKASKVTLKGTMTVDEALLAIRKQTKNEVDLHGETPDVFCQKEIDLDIKDADFWIAMTEVMEKSEIVVDTYGSEPGKLKLTPTDEARIRAANPQAPPTKPETKIKLPQNVSGIFDLVVTRVSASRNLENPKLNFCNVFVRVRWEPRVLPISIQLPVKTMKAIDDFNNPIQISNPESVISGRVQPEIPELEFSIPMGLVDRQIETVKSLEAQIDAVLPGRVETFRFKNLENLALGANQTKAGATVTYEGIIKNEDLYGVTVKLAFEEDNNALESHQSWVYSNPIHIENEAGEKFEALTQEGIGQTENSISIRYYFEQDPKKMSLFYKTPAAIVKVPVKIALKNIPLP